MFRVAFFGTPQFSVPFLESLIKDERFEVAAVVAQPDAPVGRRKVMTAPPTALLAKKHTIPVLQPEKVRKNDAFLAELRSFDADAFIVIAYGHILPQVVLDIPKQGVINVHPSLLPKYRGPSPMQAALVHGDTETGTTIMLMDHKMDHGPILAQEKFDLPLEWNLGKLTDRVHETGPQLLADTTFSYLSGDLAPQEQDHDRATICSMLSREDGYIKPDHSISNIYNLFRAYYPWPGVTLQLAGGETYKIHGMSSPRTDPTSPKLQFTVSDDKLYLTHHDGAVEITELQEAGKQRMPAKAFMNGLHSSEQQRSLEIQAMS